MKLYMILSLAALGIALASYTLAAVEHKMIGDAVSPELAEALGVSEDFLRPRLEEVLHRGWKRRGVSRSIPWLLVSGCYFWAYRTALTKSQRP